MEAGFSTLADLARETNESLDESNSRLGRLEERVNETNTQLAETNHRLGRLEHRVEDVIEIAGRETRKLRQDVDGLLARVDALEKTAS
jgi:septal ring factor EnvC (AmiA/AmiB activator)